MHRMNEGQWVQLRVPQCLGRSWDHRLVVAQHSETWNKEVCPAPVSLQPNRNWRRLRTCFPVCLELIVPPPNLFPLPSTFFCEVSSLGSQLSLQQLTGAWEGECLWSIKPGSPRADLCHGAAESPQVHPITPSTLQVHLSIWWYV